MILFKPRKPDKTTEVGLAVTPKPQSLKMYQSMTMTGKELGNSLLIKSSCLSAHANYAWLKRDVLVDSVPTSTRYPYPGCFAEPGDSHEYVDKRKKDQPLRLISAV